MKEHGELFSATSDVLKPNQFLLAQSDKEIENGQHFNNNELNIIYASYDGSLGDILIALGIARREGEKGKDTLLITNPLIQPKF